MLNSAIKDNNQNKIKSLLDNNKFSSQDDMLNSFIFKVKADLAALDNFSSAINFYNKAIKLVPSYDLKVSYSIDLIELYIDNSHFDKANKAFEEIKSIIDKIDNLPRNAQNNLDFIEYKLKQINKK